MTGVNVTLEQRAAEIAAQRTALLVTDLQSSIAKQIGAVERRALAAENEVRTLIDACEVVGEASDRLAAVRFTGSEGPARLQLERAAKALKQALERSRRHVRR